MNALGDVLMVTPLLRALIDALGPGRVDVVVREHAVPLLENFPGLGETITLVRPLYWRDPSSVVAFFWLAKKLRARRYRAVLDVSRLLQSAWLTYLAHAGRGIGFRLPRNLGPFTLEGLGYLYTDEMSIDPSAHMIRQNLTLLTPLGIAPASERIQFAPTATHASAARAWLSAWGVKPDQPYVVLHPGAKWPPKRWPIERFREVAARLQHSGLVVVLVGDKTDERVLRAIAAGLVPPPLVSAGELGLGAVGALIRQARLFLGNDSGLMHMASAVGTPMVAMFGPTLPHRTGPLDAPGCAIMKPIECRPCRLYYTRDRCERGHNYCMDLIEVEDVWSAATSMLEQKERA
jgi:predicted lipopolysaccharide heptosyltransferase III